MRGLEGTLRDSTGVMFARSVVHLASLSLVVLVLVAVGQPIWTDDLWWHLALGRAYESHGALLAADPLLFGAVGPPLPASWLADVFFFEVERTLGFAGLRGLHVALVLGILALSWRLLRVAAGRAWVASLGTAIFAAVCAYRLVQLRPHLFTILAALLLYALAFEGRRPLSRARIVLVAALLGLWANFHGGFVLGPILLACGWAGLVAAAVLESGDSKSAARGRLLPLATALVLGLLATFVSPAGLDAHLAFADAGSETAELVRVADEWRAFPWASLPASNLPPTPLTWAVVWGLFLATAAIATGWLRGLRGRGHGSRSLRVDPALLALSVASLVAIGLSVRFVFLGIFPALLCADAARQFSGSGERVRGDWRAAFAAAAVACAAVPSFLALGDWSMVSGGLRTSSQYALAYPSARYFGHAVAWLGAVGARGHLFADYSLSGYLGYRLAPGVKTTLNGTLNVPARTLDAARALRTRRGLEASESFEERLDRQQIDFFLGTRLPRMAPANRPFDHTTAHLEGVSGWIPVFRNLRSAVYLRNRDRNRENLERIAAYYEEAGVPFDLERGFEVDRVIRLAPRWALKNGILPLNFAAASALSASVHPEARNSANDSLAETYAVLGLYEKAASLDARRLRHDPEASRVRRRWVWSLLRLGRFEEADPAAAALRASAHPLSQRMARLASEALAAPKAPDLAARIARLPLLTLGEAAQFRANIPAPPLEEPRPVDRAISPN